MWRSLHHEVGVSHQTVDGTDMVSDMRLERERAFSSEE